MKTLSRFPILLGLLVPLAAVGDGRGPVFDGEVTHWQDPPSTRTREEVRQEAREALRTGEAPVMWGEFTPWNPPESRLSRARVRAEAVEASRLGLLASGEETRFPTEEEIRQVERAGELADTRDASGR